MKEVNFKCSTWLTDEEWIKYLYIYIISKQYVDRTNVIAHHKSAFVLERIAICFMRAKNLFLFSTAAFISVLMFVAGYMAFRGASITNLWVHHTYKIIIHVELISNDLRDFFYTKGIPPFANDARSNDGAKLLAIKARLDTLQNWMINNPLLLQKLGLIRNEMVKWNDREFGKRTGPNSRMASFSSVEKRLSEIIDEEYEYLDYRTAGYDKLSRKLLIMQVALATALLVSIFLLFRAKNSKEEILIKSIRIQKEAAKKVIDVQEYERERIARDLHDAIGSTLVAIKMMLHLEPLSSEKMPIIIGLISQACSDVRSISHDLIPPQFDYAGLEAMLSAHYDRLRRHCPVNFEFQQTGNDNAFSKQENLIIYRIVMELTNNVLKHSGASEASVQLLYQNKDLQIVVKDNGKGLSQADHSGIGLKNVKSRIEYLRGKLVIDSNSHGTSIVIIVPYNRE